MMNEPKQLETVSFTFMPNFSTAKNRTETWERFVDVVSRSEGFDTKEHSIKRTAIIGGQLDDPTQVGRAENVTTRTMLTLDYDDFPDGTTLLDIEYALEMQLVGDSAFVAFSTFRHTPDAPRVRVMCPLSRTVSASEYSLIVDAVVEELGLAGLDKSSKVVNQIMFLASHRHGVEPWSSSGGSGPIDVDALGIDFDFVYVDDVDDVVQGGVTRLGEALSSGGTDLEVLTAQQPLDLTDDQIDGLLAAYTAEDCGDYDEWYRVGMALWHQHRGSDDGFARWDAWSAIDADRYPGPGKLRSKWRSFNSTNRVRPITMASVIKAAGGLPAVDAVGSKDGRGGEVMSSLDDQAKAVDSREAYSAFKQRVQALSERQLTPDIRGMLAAKVHDVWAKAAGMGLGDVKRSFKPPKGKIVADGGDVAAPAWLGGWVYVDGDETFVNTLGRSRQVLKKGGFNGRFNRTDEVVAAKEEGWTDAATYALETVCIPTVYQEMYWPDFGPVFNYNGATYANSYRDNDVVPAEEGCTGAAAEAGRLFLAHLATIISDDRERNLVLDWMRYVYLNAGDRVNWALLLHGAEGNGKSYLSTVMQHLIGPENAKVVSNTSIAGRFTNWTVGRRLNTVEEVRIDGREKWAVIDKMKMYISNDTIEYEAKGVGTRSAPNFTSYMLFSNHGDAIPLTKTDRRYCIVATDQVTKEDMTETFGTASEHTQYFKRLFAATETPEGLAGIARVLVDHKYSADFDPKGKSPATHGSEEMRSFHVNEGDEALEDALEEFKGPYINDKIIDLTLLQEKADMDGVIVLPQRNALAHKLTEKGYKRAGRCKAHKKNRTVWFKPRKLSGPDALAAVQGEGFPDMSDFEDVPF